MCHGFCHGDLECSTSLASRVYSSSWCTDIRAEDAEDAEALTADPDDEHAKQDAGFMEGDGHRYHKLQ